MAICKLISMPIDFDKLNLSPAFLNPSKPVDRNVAIIEGYFIWQLCRYTNVTDTLKLYGLDFGDIVINYKKHGEIESPSPIRFENVFMETDFNKKEYSYVKEKALAILQFLANLCFIKDDVELNKKFVEYIKLNK